MSRCGQKERYIMTDETGNKISSELSNIGCALDVYGVIVLCAIVYGCCNCDGNSKAHAAEIPTATCFAPPKTCEAIATMVATGYVKLDRNIKRLATDIKRVNTIVALERASATAMAKKYYALCTPTVTPIIVSNLTFQGGGTSGFKMGMNDPTPVSTECAGLVAWIEYHPDSIDVAGPDPGGKNWIIYKTPLPSRVVKHIVWVTCTPTPAAPRFGR